MSSYFAPARQYGEPDDLNTIVGYVNGNRMYLDWVSSLSMDSHICIN